MRGSAFFPRVFPCHPARLAAVASFSLTGQLSLATVIGSFLKSINFPRGPPPPPRDSNAFLESTLSFLPFRGRLSSPVQVRCTATGRSPFPSGPFPEFRLEDRPCVGIDSSSLFRTPVNFYVPIVVPIFFPLLFNLRQTFTHCNESNQIAHFSLHLPPVMTRPIIPPS